MKNNNRAYNTGRWIGAFIVSTLQLIWWGSLFLSIFVSAWWVIGVIVSTWFILMPYVICLCRMAAIADDEAYRAWKRSQESHETLPPDHVYQMPEASDQK